MHTLLIIDDEPSILTTFGEVFQRLGFTVLTASSAAEGLDLFMRQRPDVVLLDLGLPDQPGLAIFIRFISCMPGYR